MRILHVSPFFTPEMGGSAQVAYQMARHLGDLGHTVTVLSSDYGIRGSRFPPGPFEVVLLPGTIARWGFYINPGLPRWAARNVGRFDVVHMHTVRTFQNVVVSRAAVRKRVPYVLSAHGTLPIILERRAAKQVFDRLFGGYMLRSASRFIAVSPLEVTQYAQVGIAPEAIALIPNGLNLQEFTDLPVRGTFRSKMGFPETVALILFLGRLHPVKGIDVLIDALAHIRTGELPVILVVAGPDDGVLTELRRRVGALGLQDQVAFPGPLYGAEKLAAYVDADVVASPSAYEIFGLVPFEALLCGTPVVMTETCGAGAWIRDAGAGRVVRSGDVHALAAALRAALEDRDGTSQQVARGQAFIKKHMDWQATDSPLMRVYGDVTAQGLRMQTTCASWRAV